MSTLRSLQSEVVAVLVDLNHHPALVAALSDLQGAWAPLTGRLHRTVPQEGPQRRDSYTLSVRFLEKDAIERFDPSFPEIASRFERCKF